MPYQMKFQVDGNCHRNGQPDAIAAAAAILLRRYGPKKGWTRSLPASPPPTNQRAEITAIILALEQALARYPLLHTRPKMRVTIYSDSQYAVKCMTKWRYKWTGNGWRNTRGREVVNRDLLEQAAELDRQVRQLGRLKVRYEWIAREENWQADRLCRRDIERQILRS
ncbi:ribonuclease H1 [Aspergillus saccharolyticus JOP 1030-1]|uniref:ribonuclease H n=1 Tax=Aspergillus saccharolyticus JOP 1030-1 TaxID=1450539 RepID=A0A318ZJN7_9EURO|nr:ribonuclease H1 [Aspergillus saccharolyticus JOP 1030-1]PYH40478.1 ribonuclease H1 [Aspergillus saccharolyticus JOP 1030-1]